MKDTHKTIQYVLVILALILSVVGSYYGIVLPAPNIPTPEPIDFSNVDTRGIKPTQFTAIDISHGLTVGGDLSVTGDSLFGGNYPVGNAAADKELVCGTTATFTGSITIASELTAIDTVIATQITAPAATRAFLVASDPTTTTFTLSSKNSTYGAGTTGLTAHYCVVGTK